MNYDELEQFRDMQTRIELLEADYNSLLSTHSELRQLMHNGLGTQQYAHNALCDVVCDLIETTVQGYGNDVKLYANASNARLPQPSEQVTDTDSDSYNKDLADTFMGSEQEEVCDLYLNNGDNSGGNSVDGGVDVSGVDLLMSALREALYTDDTCFVHGHWDEGIASVERCVRPILEAYEAQIDYHKRQREASDNARLRNQACADDYLKRAEKAEAEREFFSPLTKEDTMSLMTEEAHDEGLRQDSISTGNSDSGSVGDSVDNDNVGVVMDMMMRKIKMLYRKHKHFIWLLLFGIIISMFI
jgi:hypothetical protein